MDRNNMTDEERGTFCGGCGVELPLESQLNVEQVRQADERARRQFRFNGRVIPVFMLLYCSKCAAAEPVLRQELN